MRNRNGIAILALLVLSIFVSLSLLLSAAFLIGRPELNSDNPARVIVPEATADAVFPEGSHIIIMIPIPFGKSVMVSGPQSYTARWAPSISMVGGPGANGSYAPDEPVWIAILPSEDPWDKLVLPEHIVDSLFAGLKNEYQDQTCTKIEELIAFLNEHKLNIDLEALRDSLKARCV